jgi:hypothetical protein
MQTKRPPGNLRMSQEEFEMYANLAVSLNGRLQEANKLLKRRQGPHGEVLGGIEEAYEHERLFGEAAGLREELAELAVETYEQGMPLAVWIRVRREGERDAKVRLLKGEKKGNFVLAVEVLK